MNRRLVLFLLVPALVATMVGVGLASGRGSATPDGGEEPSPSLSPVPAVTAAPSPPVVPSASPSPSPSPTPTPAAPPSPPAANYDVVAAQRTLAEHGYYVGAIDGSEGPAMRSAVMAFQKVHGLGADGVVGPNTLAALAAPKAPALQGGPATRIEVDLTKQVLYFVQGGALRRIMPVSSGNGATYAEKGGGTAKALTPVGTYKIERRIRGERKADLGTLYDPLYFYKGWAIHGSNSVPAYPASHGCVRVTRADALWLFDRAPNGTTVILYGGTHVFTRGSDAAGTDAPAGDTPQDAPSEPAASASPSPSASAQPQPSTPAPTPTPAPQPPPSQPAPTPAPPAQTEEPPAEPAPEPQPAAGEEAPLPVPAGT